MNEPAAVKISFRFPIGRGARFCKKIGKVDSALHKVESQLGSDFAVDFRTKYPTAVVGDAVAVAQKMLVKYTPQFSACAPARL